MGYALLWIENLTVSLLLVALSLACVGRLRRRWLRRVLSVPVPLLLLLFYAAVTSAVGYLQLWRKFTDRWFYPVLALAVFFLGGAVWLLIRGLRRAEAGTEQSAAATWPRGKLAIALGAAAAVHLMTFWNLDLAARQQLAALRIEAGAVAMSVAPPAVADRDNAALIYQQAFEGLPSTDVFKIVFKGKLDRWDGLSLAHGDTIDPDLVQLLEEHAARLALLREAATRPDCCFQPDYGWFHIDTKATGHARSRDFNHLRVAANLLNFDALVKAAAGDTRTALGDIRSMLALARHVCVERYMINVALGTVIERMAKARLEDILLSKKVSADDLAELHIEEHPSYQKLFERALRWEEASASVALYEFGGGLYGWGDVDPKAPDWCNSRVLNVLYRMFLLSDDLAVRSRWTQRCQELAAQPYWETKSQWQEVQERWAREHVSLAGHGFAAHALVEVIARGDAVARLVRLGLALEQYRAHHGKFPAALEDLVPEFIPSVPIDPFDGKPMKLKRTDHGIVIYSIGPEVTSKGAAPSDKERKTTNITFELRDGKR